MNQGRATVAEHLPGICEAQDSIPRAATIKTTGKTMPVSFSSKARKSAFKVKMLWGIFS